MTDESETLHDGDDAPAETLSTRSVGWRLPPGSVPAPPRPGERHVRVPRYGIILSDDDVRRAVDRAFHKPMIVLALAILPLLVIEFLLFNRQPDLREGWLGVAVPVGFAVIWLAFFVELVVKVTLAECRIEYLRRHWLDVAIVMMPLLRPLRIAKVARTARVFTLRGVGMKTVRYGFALFLGVEAGERLARRLGLRREGVRDPATMTRHQLVSEVKRLRRQVDGWELWFDEHRQHRDTFGVDHHFEVRAVPEVPEVPGCVEAGDGPADPPRPVERHSAGEGEAAGTSAPSEP